MTRFPQQYDCTYSGAKEGGLPRRRIFVFGSNLAGRHGKGAALAARKDHGAIYGKAEGLQGSAYAIPTKSSSLVPLPLETIAGHVATFLTFAEYHPELIFSVTPIGTGLAGYTPADIAPMFRLAPANVRLPQVFLEVLAR